MVKNYSELTQDLTVKCESIERLYQLRRDLLHPQRQSARRNQNKQSCEPYSTINC